VTVVAPSVLIDDLEVTKVDDELPKLPDRAFAGFMDYRPDRRRAMKILSRYVFREILTSSFLATALATFVIFLQGIGRLFALLVGSAKGVAVLELFALALPPVLLFSIPFGVLVGILVGLGRLSSDNEMIAMRSGGVSSRIVVAPVLVFAFVAMLISGACAAWLNPLAIRAEYKILNRIAAAQLTADVEPRVFEDQFTNDTTVLYVDDVKSEGGPVVVWNGVFIADLTPPAERKTGLKDANPGSPGDGGARSAGGTRMSRTTAFS
jgi:lipopolysaccharide export LptBFGC system permease protein LptF